MEVTRQEAMMGVRPLLPGTGKQWSRGLDEGCGSKEAAVGPRLSSELLASQQVLRVLRALTVLVLDAARDPMTGRKSDRGVPSWSE